jgi:hypothetical protein
VTQLVKMWAGSIRGCVWWLIDEQVRWLFEGCGGYIWAYENVVAHYGDVTAICRYEVAHFGVGGQ